MKRNVKFSFITAGYVVRNYEKKNGYVENKLTLDDFRTLTSDTIRDVYKTNKNKNNMLS